MLNKDPYLRVRIQRVGCRCFRQGSKSFCSSCPHGDSGVPRQPQARWGFLYRKGGNGSDRRLVPPRPESEPGAALL